MHSFYDNLPLEPALEIERLSRLLYELRENRATVLAPWAAADEAALLARIVAGEIEPHPAYDHYLAARILSDTRESVRRAISNQLQGRTADDVEEEGLLHLELHARLVESYADQLEGEPALSQDALLARFANGATLEVRYAAPDAYALRWRWGEVELGIDTAPAEGDERPSHLYDAAGRIQADPLTDTSRAPWDNLRAVVEAVLADPLLKA